MSMPIAFPKGQEAARIIADAMIKDATTSGDAIPELVLVTTEEPDGSFETTEHWAICETCGWPINGYNDCCK